MTQQEHSFAASTLSGYMTTSVRTLYERYPYPHYPLLAKPRWQEGWMTGSTFNCKISGQITGTMSNDATKRILVAGCGEILPAVISAQEPFNHKIDAIDLSTKSILRARFRCASELFRLRIRQGDLVTWMRDQEQSYDHIDCYGVLHHLANPLATLSSLNGALKPGGTARIMVYNTPARSWIHQWQQVFRDLKLSANSEDILTATNVLKTATLTSPSLKRLLKQMGLGILTNHTRFADTFLHPREARIGPASWFEEIRRLGIQIIGLFDRYSELDDLPNSLWGVDIDHVLTRIAHGTFQNNLELILQKPGGQTYTNRTNYRRLLAPFSAPPRAWTTTEETTHLRRSLTRSIWHHHQLHLSGRSGMLPSQIVKKLNNDALKRLARLGAILPAQLDETTRERARAPLKKNNHQVAVFVGDNKDLNRISGDMAALIDRTCERKKIHQRFRPTIDARLNRAINPKLQPSAE